VSCSGLMKPCLQRQRWSASRSRVMWTIAEHLRSITAASRRDPGNALSFAKSIGLNELHNDAQRIRAGRAASPRVPATTWDDQPRGMTRACPSVRESRCARATRRAAS
jgi:hypothetical protein